MPALLRSAAAVAALLATQADGTSMMIAKLCRGQTCNDAKFPLMDFNEEDNSCQCIAHPCWNDNGLKHECKEEAFPHLSFVYLEDGTLQCSCSKTPHYGSPYIAKDKCSGHACEDDFPVLDFDEDKGECLCRKSPCDDMDGQKHECNQDEFPILRYREDEDEETGEVKTVCECMAPLREPAEEL
eukprot:gnl/TRDRNA2_/TRDRNA2_180281_c0_seq1.p1 gnl/TRDRNA2_/TRDRNA2_180281_c0~~gnl/TRDRNA2_/TRDRNA2_180281_c0_seq1.p1  ORF type:complete len:184 (+),score=43.80 gnl/TRDRNA2_/TRDRNA2_180281_c0_seq1:61-612(+)